MLSTLRRTLRPAARRILGILVVLALITAPRGAAAQEGHEHEDGHAHEHGDHGHSGLHFTHPMIAESVTPDTKVRIDHQFFDFPDGTREHSGVLEAEYAFHRSVSLEVGLPYSYTDGQVGNLSALLKLANFGFEDSGVLLGYGLGVTFPTNGTPEHTDTDQPGAEHASVRPSMAVSSPPPPRLHGGPGGVTASLGTQEWELEPYLNLGYRGGAWEMTAWTRFAIPFRHADQHDVGTELRWSASALFHASSRVQGLLELDGSTGVSGHAVGDDFLLATPGLRLKPFPDQPLWIGSAVGFPVASSAGDPFDVRWKSSLFWHFPM
jgi:hypothetical protein